MELMKDELVQAVSRRTTRASSRATTRAPSPTRRSQGDPAFVQNVSAKLAAASAGNESPRLGVYHPQSRIHVHTATFTQAGTSSLPPQPGPRGDPVFSGPLPPVYAWPTPHEGP